MLGAALGPVLSETKIGFSVLNAHEIEHGRDSNDATCAVVRVLCIPLHAKTCCRPSISTVLSYLGRQQNH